jgi:hypothetical protein
MDFLVRIYRITVRRSARAPHLALLKFQNALADAMLCPEERGDLERAIAKCAGVAVGDAVHECVLLCTRHAWRNARLMPHACGGGGGDCELSR